MSTITLDGKKYDVICAYEKDNKKYLIYTENKEDKDGFIKAYAGIYNEEKEELLPIKNDNEIEMINSILEKLTKER